MFNHIHFAKLNWVNVVLTETAVTRIHSGIISSALHSAETYSLGMGDPSFQEG